SYVSPSCESVLGYKPEELIGQRPNIVHPDDSDLVQKIFSQALQGGSSPSFQYRIQTKKGETKWISHVFTTLKQDNRLEMIVSTLRDLTEIKLVEKELFEKISLLENSERATLNIMDDLQETIGRVEQAKADINQHEIHLENLFALYKMENVTDKEIFNFTLQATLKSTQSELGFIETMSKAEMVETIQAWSKQVAGQCNIMDKTVQFPITQTGLLEEIVRQRKPLIVNDYESSTEFKKGYLTGPVPIKRFLGIPIFSADRIVAVGVVANKMAEYTESDVKYFSSLLHEMWNCIERKQAGDALNESEERHRVLFESSQDALMTIEPPSWNFTSGNPATLELFKAKSEEEFTSQGPGGLSPERQPDGRPSAEKAKEMIETAIRNGSCFFEWTHKRLDGEDFSATVLLSRIKQGEKVFLQATVRDITEMKEIQQKLIKAYDEVKKLAKQKNDFINQLGHDLKNPLGPIINLLPIVTEDTKDSKLLEVLDVINRNAMYMKELVMNTLALAQLEGKTINFDFQILDLFTLVENTIADNGYLLEENNIKTENRMDKEIAVNADALRLKEVLTNLLSNSIHYMYKYGVEKTGGKIIINAKKDNNFVTVSIQDTGVGLTVKQLEHLFEEFYKADSSRHDRQSTGLGLAICKRIVEKHGGKIWVDSEGLEKGSTFFFTIPISINQETNNRKNN
ncbi:MAG: PAS domain S-box protein, partial [Euryarchaeota archaeon]|nr:PAS domain S-box protein [Euryarchaeota archaeon]